MCLIRLYYTFTKIPDICTFFHSNHRPFLRIRFSLPDILCLRYKYLSSSRCTSQFLRFNVVLDMISFWFLVGLFPLLRIRSASYIHFLCHSCYLWSIYHSKDCNRVNIYIYCSAQSICCPAYPVQYFY